MMTLEASRSLVKMSWTLSGVRAGFGKNRIAPPNWSRNRACEVPLLVLDWLVPSSPKLEHTGLKPKPMRFLLQPQVLKQPQEYVFHRKKLLFSPMTVFVGQSSLLDGRKGHHEKK